MSTIRDIVYMTVADLRNANDAARMNNYGRTLTNDFIDSLPSNVKLPVTHAFSFDDRRMRVRFVWNAEGECEFIDMTYERFERLPRITPAGMFTRGEPVH